MNNGRKCTAVWRAWKAAFGECFSRPARLLFNQELRKAAGIANAYQGDRTADYPRILNFGQPSIAAGQLDRQTPLLPFCWARSNLKSNTQICLAMAMSDSSIPSMEDVKTLVLHSAFIIGIKANYLEQDMVKWLHPYAFVAWALAIAVFKFLQMPEDGISPGWVGSTLGAVVGGGLFWGAITTLFYNNYLKK